MKPILNPLDQTSQIAVVNNTVCDAQVTLQTGNSVLVNAAVDNLDLGWQFASNAPFGDLNDGNHMVWEGDFTGGGRHEILFNYGVDGNWFLGTVEGSVLTWRLVATTGFGDLADDAHAVWQGDFSGAGRTQILFHYRGDGNWWLGTLNADHLDWQLLGNTAGFGNLLDAGHRIWIGNFTGQSRLEVMFHFSGDGNWWLGTIGDQSLDWTNVGNTSGFGNLLDGSHEIWTGKFADAHRSQLLFNYFEDGHFWLGTIDRGELAWSLAAVASFGDLRDNHHPHWTGDFSGSGRDELVFYFDGDGHWWHGTVSDSTLTWTMVATAQFGNLLDAEHRIWRNRFSDQSREQLLFYYRGDGNWWLGDVHGGTMLWSRLGNTAGFGNLLDDSHAFWQGEFCGNGLSSLLFYCAGDGNWWHGRTDGKSMTWWVAGNTRGFGNLLDGHHVLWSGRFSGGPKSEVLFYYRDDGNTFLGQFDGVHLRLPRTLEPGEVLVAQQRIGGAAAVHSDPVTVNHNFATQHYDRQRTGWNFREITLSPDNVGSLRNLYTLPTDDQVYTQPLYVQDVQIAGGGVHNVIYVATESNTVYAFDADNNRLLLSRSLLRDGEHPVPSLKIYSAKAHNIFPFIGVTGTPVVDRATNSLFVVSKCEDKDGNCHQRLYSLELGSLGTRPCVVKIAAESGPARFDALASNQRTALLLSGGVLYVGFGAHGDQHPNNYFGWMLAFDASTLNPLATFNAAPDSLLTNGQAGIWQSGHGPAADPEGNIYFTTGNGTFAPVHHNFSNSVMKLGSGLEEIDYFAPVDQDYLNKLDMDLGSGGVLVLPDQSSTPQKLVLTGGKQGYIYLLNRDGMGGHGAAFDNVTQKLELYPGHVSHEPGNPIGSDASQVGMFGGPAYFNGEMAQLVYVCGTGGDGMGQLVSYELANSQLGSRTNSNRRFSSGGTPGVTSHGRNGASAVVWVLDRTAPLKLVALRGDDLTQVLLDVDAGPWTNTGTPGVDTGGIPFLQPMVIAGKVYVPSSAGVNVFGLG